MDVGTNSHWVTFDGTPDNLPNPPSKKKVWAFQRVENAPEVVISHLGKCKYHIVFIESYCKALVH